MPGLSEAFDGEDVGALDFEGGVKARIDGQAVDEHGANAAFGLIASDLRASKAEPIAEDLSQVFVLADVSFDRLAIDCEFEQSHSCLQPSSIITPSTPRSP